MSGLYRDILARLRLLTQSAELSAVNILTLQPFTAGNEPLQLHVQSFANAAPGVGYNHGAFLGWNAGRHSGLSATAGKPAILVGFEDNYYDPPPGDGFYGTEWYVQHWSPDGLTELRPFYARCEIDNAANNATIFHEIGTDRTGSWQVRRAVGDPILFASDAGVAVYGTNGLTLMDGTLRTIGVVGRSGANLDLGLSAGNAAGQILFQNAAGDATNINVGDSGDTIMRGTLTINAAGGLTLSAGTAKVIGVVGNSGANLDLGISAGNAAGQVLIRNAAGSATNVSIDDSGNIALRDAMTFNNFGATGMKFGGSNAQKIGFWGAAPVARPSGTPAAAADPATTMALVNSLRASLLLAGLIE